MDIKLVIWDLDDTLWNGTLAEGDQVTLNEDFAALLKSLNERGVVSSICSKNDFDKAKAKLEAFGLWDQLVFPFLSFSPKGEAVSAMIEQMQLRPINVLFIDDNRNNLAEVKAREPEIHVADALETSTLETLRSLVAKYDGVRKSRIEKYRALEARHKAWRESSASREKFLYDSEITMALVERADNAEFADRIEELINRTNQMNYTQSRVESGSLRERMSLNDVNFEPCSIFVWDKYGYHGLVGFALIENRTTLKHFLFSCRIMHMGVEQRTLHELLRRRPTLDVGSAQIPVNPEPSPWITLRHFYEPDIREKIQALETKRTAAKAKVRLIVNCQSSALAHYGGFSDYADSDIWPRSFNLQSFAIGAVPAMHRHHSPYNEIGPEKLVYGVFNDYHPKAWSPEYVDRLDAGLYEECARKFAAFIVQSGRKAFILLPPTESRFFTQRHLSDGISPEKIAGFNAIWEELADKNPQLTRMKVGTDAATADFLADADEIADFSHFRPRLLRRLGVRIANWLDDGATGPARP